jgi:hypothetical protein
LYQDLWGKQPEIQQPFMGKPEGPVSYTELLDLMPTITTKEIAARVTCTKKDSCRTRQNIEEAPDSMVNP